MGRQTTLFEAEPTFPSTRFQGSKLKIIDWIWSAMEGLNFNTALDAFGGTGCVAYMLKQKGKKVTYNDALKFNRHIGLALIENDCVKLTEKDTEFLLTRHDKIKYPAFVYDTFKNIYFTDEENRWIDMVVTNINSLDGIYKKSLAYFALFQSCIIKRPYNLFHRKNLYVRLSDVKRNFGNKTTWDTPFNVHFEKFAGEANAAVFSNGQENTAMNSDIFDVKDDYDLVYIDTPYISQKGGGVDYHDFYHFLEGLVNYQTWGDMIAYDTKHKRLKNTGSPWTDKNSIHLAFDKLFEKFKNSILVVSYRSDGIPTVEELIKLLKKYKNDVKEMQRKSYKYALSSNHTEEVLLVGK
ncbi:MAG: DNA adenine methylase [Deltaproteobacteria bacterium]